MLSYIGLQVKLTLHSQPGSTLQAKILSIDQATNTLTVQKQDGSQTVLKRTDIADLAACKSAETTSNGTADSSSSARSHTATPVTSQGKQKKPQESAAQPAAAPYVDPAIVSHSQPNTAPSSAGSHATSLLASLQASDPAASRSSTPSRSPRPKPASASAPSKSAKKKQPIARSDSPALSEEFDFSAGLAAFDKKKIWDDIRASDHTDPASLLVSHNRIANGPVELVRGPNGVGPANSVSTPERGRSAKDGQQKLRINEMVCSPSPERVPSPPAASTARAEVSVGGSAETGKPTYEQLEERVRKLEAELALARRRNVLLEELAGLGLGVHARGDASADYTTAPATSSSARADTNASAAQQKSGPADPVADTEQHLSALSILDPPKSDPSALSNALAAAGFAISTSNPTSGAMTPTSVAPTEPDHDPLFGHILSPPILTLLFPTAALQHSALARMEAFYESSSTSKAYLSLQQAADERICRNYQGFNLPLSAVREWLEAMHESTSSSDLPRWWAEHCSGEENDLLDLLVTHNAIAVNEGAVSRSGEGGEVSYLISCVASQAHSTLPHELLHALYFLSPTYRSEVDTQYDSLSPQNRKVIETDLGLRKYAPEVWRDEFQAYLAEGLGSEKEFGNKPAAECKVIAEQLRAQVKGEWSRLGLDVGAQEAKWEEVKWQTLDRYAAVQKADKKAKAGVAGKGKGGKKKK
ncbi:DFDF domain protein [Kalmanozyma brasiliensis GHG001]|uniref:DFDF domain-containing protein n=1 Tax=Kalmanozyma brasiliensis (strain GHG001) TaxID=1365824 RepID=V5EYD3_KALBG|nr:DFDF domain protein [Kalmanozyma brasiliensis GHG001]EST07719.1 DFDF domain protein [Kalmanozyma brasiliensis GHG001]